jgi:hypothetical protein
MRQSITKALLGICALGASATIAAVIVDSNHTSLESAYNKWLAEGNTGSAAEFGRWIQDSSRNFDRLSDQLSAQPEAIDSGYTEWQKTRPAENSSLEEYIDWVKLHARETETTVSIPQQPEETPSRIVEVVVEKPVEVIVEKTVETVIEKPTEIIVEKIVESDTADKLWLSEGNVGTREQFTAWIKDMTVRQYESKVPDDTSVFKDTKFESLVTEFNGAEQSLVVTGAPEGTQIHYADNTATNVGTYRGFAYLVLPGVEAKVVTAQLTITKINITAAELPDKTFTYDGTTKTIEVIGAPANTNIEYTSNGSPFTGATEAGTYTVTATITGEDYNTFTTTATLTIEKADITTVNFKSATVTYDGKEHTIFISGSRPAGISLEYTCGGSPFTSATEAGVYEISAYMPGNSNYNPRTLTATLTINKADIGGIFLDSYSTTYDGTAKPSPSVANPPPAPQYPTTSKTAAPPSPVSPTKASIQSLPPSPAPTTTLCASKPPSPSENSNLPNPPASTSTPPFAPTARSTP